MVSSSCCGCFIFGTGWADVVGTVQRKSVPLLAVDPRCSCVTLLTEFTGSYYGKEVYTVHISIYIILSVLVDRSHLDMEVISEKRHDRRVGVAADCAIKLSFSASMLIASSTSMAWFLSSETEREGRT